MVLRSLLCLASLHAWGDARDVGGLRIRHDNASDDTLRDPFRRRGSQSAAVLDGYLYLEGGEISSYYDGEREGNRDTTAMTSTQAISLAESWSNETVEINIIRKTEPESVKRPALWVDEAGGRIFRWGGARPGSLPIQADNATLWAFSSNSDGGEWSEQSPYDQSEFEPLLAGSGTAFGACGGKGLAAGGHVFDSTDARYDGNIVPLPGMLVYDIAKRTWANESTVPVHSPTGTFNLASGWCVPGVATNPVFLILGGADTTAESFKENEMRSFANITFYDPVEEQWHWQAATGNVPPGRDLACAAGMQEVNGTYEIFLHGGRHPVDGTLSDIFILSLPGFEWFRIEDHNSTARHSHACADIGHGQLVVSGGVNSDGSWKQQDNWRYGLGVWDMSAMRWSDGYDANADDYRTPEMIRSWYDDGGLDSVEWSSDAVRDMFTDGDSKDDSGSETPVGAIAGGVVGGVAGLALIGGLVFFFLRRRRRNQPSAVDVPEPSPPSPSSSTGAPGQKPSPSHYTESHPSTSPWPAELEHQQKPSELETDWETQMAPVELATEANQRAEANS